MSFTAFGQSFSSDLEEAIEARKTSRQIASEADVEAALERIAMEATQVLAQANPLILAVMQGGAFTAVELCRRFDFPYEFDFIHVTRYGQSLTGGKLSWRVLPSVALERRTVLVVDDILDRGITLAALYEELEQSGVSKLYSAVLVSKNLESPGERVDVDFIGLEVEDAYVFGCGMDYKGYWRGLKALHAVDPS